MKIVKYRCDGCGKEISNGSEEVLYQQGWFQINMFNAYVPKLTHHRVQDDVAEVEMGESQFCSRDCFLHLLMRKLENVQQPTVGGKPLNQADISPSEHPKPIDNAVERPEGQMHEEKRKGLFGRF